ncbi:ATP-dependent DNA helicase [Candidatus Ruminimicrobium bovinum]|uniref:ATP-dependent DNA helicase n=1 Tax=Candidatus Ruminimicrobium bovinum TaxID=3242779 RepID=UPI0039B88D45
MNKIEINQDFSKALDLLLNTNENVFITGKAGTGKTTFLKLATEELKKKNKKFVVLATTGVAALNAGGQTIHSFFHFGRDVSYSRIYKTDPSQIAKYQHLDTIIIDEASMLRADLLDCIDKFLRINASAEEKKMIAFAGIQMVFIGDLYQLPPVVKNDEADQFTGELPQTEDEIINLITAKRRPKKYDSCYFLSSFCLRKSYLHIINFDKIYRQKDEQFINILNDMRENNISQTEIDILNKQTTMENIPSVIKLTTMNETANNYNKQELQKLNKATEQEFYAIIEGNRDKIKPNDYPTEQTITLRVGARIMMLINDSDGKYINGTMGTVTRININRKSFFNSTITVKLDNGHIVNVERNEWAMYETVWSEQEQDYVKVKVASFKQYPIRLAWAITIHKSQGKTFDKILVDLGTKGAFASGQTYVAISRCTSIQGINLVIPIQLKDIIVDDKIKQLLDVQQKINTVLEQDKNSFFEDAV